MPPTVRDRTQEEWKDLLRRIQKEEDEIQQILGKALHYPWYKDDQVNFPGATEEDGVCVGEHVVITLAMEAAKKIEELERKYKELSDLRKRIL